MAENIPKKSPTDEITNEIRRKYKFRPFIDAPLSKTDADILELPIIDLSKFDISFDERKKLANTLESALTHYGFFRLINHGFTPEFLDHLKSISQSTFETTDEIKSNFFAGKTRIDIDKDLELGVIRGTGYKPKGYWTYTNNTTDNVEFYNFRHFLHPEIFFNQIQYPEFVKYHLNDIRQYFNYLHTNIQRKVLTLMDIILELPEGTLYNNFFPSIENDVINSGTGFGRFLLYHPVDNEYIKNTSSTWLRGHTDAGALTFILSQSILSLQIRSYDDDKWKYVSHVPNSIIVNIGDTFKFLTDGYFKSSIHRVHTAPDDQQNYTRNTIIYFASPKLDIFMDSSSLNSPKLKRLGYKLDDNLEQITVRQWDEAKGKFFNKTSANRQNNLTLYGRESIGSLINESAANLPATEVKV
ncbi:hypothetical protein C6P40_000648 [Pichia californica]|uniref:Fe2OG dioxygenase domain-containing protein n=1 Tax=Pichia californica TaxID=460514 RepID=A0A9P7BI40_9ASCO|nr:hypothetical protein C6P42_001986 [[Candida] californica]KAG0690934.1 hypothetical protein C6P40_000648 [[Candida] californica]